jgi:hypothetical protein
VLTVELVELDDISREVGEESVMAPIGHNFNCFVSVNRVRRTTRRRGTARFPLRPNIAR